MERSAARLPQTGDSHCPPILPSTVPVPKERSQHTREEPSTPLFTSSLYKLASPQVPGGIGVSGAFYVDLHSACRYINYTGYDLQLARL
jgi:hypothetical protein